MDIGSHKVIVTGAASGLGAATAAYLAQCGARVMGFDLAADAGSGLKAVGAGFAQADVTDADSVAAAIAAAVTDMGGITAVVNCAGIAPAERILGRDGPHSLDLFRKVIEVNLIGSFNVLRLAAVEMARNDGPERGVIVNTASVAAFDGQKGQAAYTASKAAIVGMTLPLARDLATQGIRAVTIAPGVFATAMLRALPQEVQDRVTADVTFPRRAGEPEEFARLVAYVLTSEYLNGETIRLDGALRLG